MGVFGKICLSLAGAIVVGFLLSWAAAAGPNPGQGFLFVYLFVFGLPAAAVLALVGGFSYAIAKVPPSAVALPPLEADPKRVNLWVAGVLAAMAGYQFLSRLAFSHYRSTESWLVFLTLAIGAGVVWRLALRTSPSAPDVPMVETAGEPT